MTRPGRMRVRHDDREHRVDEALRLPAVTMSFHGAGPHVEPELPDPVWPQDVAPVLRPDGLVAERPDGWWVQYDDPMWQSYTWVAMLDPVELSHHVEVSRPRADVVNGRAVWRAEVRPEDGYDPRCGCCPLLWSEISDRDEYGEDWTPQPGTVHPDAYDVALDQQTGVVVRCLPVGRSSLDWLLEVDIHEVDSDLDIRL